MNDIDIEDVINKKSLDNLKSKTITDFVIELSKTTYNSKNDFEYNIRKLSKTYSIMPSRPGILQIYNDLLDNNTIIKNQSLENFCNKKRVRSESGVLVVTVLTTPYPEYTNIHGIRKKQSFSCGENCSYCPNEPEIIINCSLIKANMKINERFIELYVTTDDNMDHIRVFNHIEIPEYNLLIDRVNVKNVKNNNFIIEINSNKINISKLYPNLKIKATKMAQPRSYISSESGVARGNQNYFDAFNQFIDRLSALKLCGHPEDKIEILVLGGTWSDYPTGYQEEFIRDLHYAANVYYDIISNNDYSNIREKKSLNEEMKININAKCRIIGLTLETRPDRVNKREIIKMRNYNCTRIQMGVQHLDDDILKKINRNCYLKDTINSLRLLKDNGFKVDIHLMPDLPGSDIEKDKLMFYKLQSIINIRINLFYKHWFIYNLLHPELQADQWKIYPCEVTPWTQIEKWYKEGSYKPYGEDESKILELIYDIKINIFPWIRLNRVIRDFEFESTVIGGNKNPSLRDKIHKELYKRGHYCKCIRCREIGNISKRYLEYDSIIKNNNRYFINLKPVKSKKNIYNHLSMKLEIKLVIRQYNTNNGIEYFLSFETIDYRIIFGFLRLRINFSDEYVYFDQLKDCALIRELHVYGSLIKHDDYQTKKTQHIGFGKLLIEEAENISYIYHNKRKISVISGIGVREYYEKRGFITDKSNYMIKYININFYNLNYYHKIYIIINSIKKILFDFVFMLLISTIILYFWIK